MPAITSDVEICNMAINRVGGERISSLGDTSSKEGRLLNSIYARSRRSLIKQYSWPFARKRKQLTRLAETPEYEYDYAYSFPADCLSILHQTNDAGEWSTAKYRIEGTSILSDEEEMFLFYVADVTDPTKFSEEFVEVFIAYLAKEIAYPLTRDVNLRRDMKQEYAEAVNDCVPLAINQDSIEQHTTSQYEEVRGEDG